MKKMALMVIGALVLLLLSNMTVIASAATDDEQKINIPNEWKGKQKVVIPHGNSIVQIVYIQDKNSPRVTKSDTILTPTADGAYDDNGWYWKLSDYPKGVPYIINPSSANLIKGTSQKALISATRAGFEAWNSAVAQNIHQALYSYQGTNTRIRASGDNPDHRNVVSWARISDPNTVAFTNMWAYDIGNGRYQFFDCDIVFNNYWKWGVDKDGITGGMSPEAYTFDIQDICTHETGHWTGLDDLYDSQYDQMTMYGYAFPGEVLKRSLADADEIGAQFVYPSV